MSTVSRLTSAAAAGYLLGTFPTADLVARRVSRGRVDLRRSGSGNPGSANALNVLGKRAAVQVLVGDIGKGVVASALGGSAAGPVGAHLAGTSAVVGHCFPVWTGFRGGKGVATSVGQCLATFPAYFPFDAVVAVVTVANPRWRQRAFAATVASSACWIAGGIVWWVKGLPNLWGPKPSAWLPLAAAVSSGVIVSRFVASSPPTAGAGSTDPGPAHPDPTGTRS